jgi:putative peptidoglycan lipid II flippase
MPKEFLVVSIALLTALSICIQGILAYQLLKKKIGGLSGFGLTQSSVKFVLAALPASAAGVAVLLALGGISGNSFALQSIVGAVSSSLVVGSVMALAYLLLLWLMKSQELRELGFALRGRFTRNNQSQ